MGNKIKRDPFWDDFLTDEQVVEMHKLEKAPVIESLGKSAAQSLLDIQDGIEMLMDVALSRLDDPALVRDLTRIVDKLHKANERHRRLVIETLYSMADKVSERNAKRPLKTGLTVEDIDRARKALQRESNGKRVSQEKLAERLGISRQTLWKLTRNG